MIITPEESLERALADVEMLLSAYPDEATLVKDDDGDNGTNSSSSFPLHVQLTLSETACITLEWVQGYPVETSVQIQSYRSTATEKASMDRTVKAVREAAAEALKDQIEAGFTCVAVAKETWDNQQEQLLLQQGQSAQEEKEAKDNSHGSQHLIGEALSLSNKNNNQKVFEWKTGEPLTDRKSAFQAHVCRIERESDVRPALFQLLDGNSKLHRATHNLWAYRVREIDETKSNRSIWKHDNDDDGEDAAGSRLAHLLEMRQEDGVLVVVSRWFGGIHLGPKRFAHISNVARDLLVQCHEDGTLLQTPSSL